MAQEQNRLMDEIYKQFVKETNQEDDKNIEIKSNYQPKLTENSIQYSKCQNCNQMIPTKQMSEHLKIELMNPEAYQQKVKSTKASNSSAINEGNDIAQNLQSLKRKRPDIFRQQGQDLKDQLYEDNEKIEKKILWNGQDSNMTRTTANIAIMQHQQRKNNIDLQNKSSNLDQSQNYINISQQINNNILQNNQDGNNIKPPNLGENKKQQDKQQDIIEEGIKLQDEQQWLKKYDKEIKINIRVPEFNKEEIMFKCQTIQFLLPPSTSILQIKIQIAQKLKNLPASKQNLRSSLFKNLKDENTLAYYNIINNSIFQLEII